MTKKTNAEIMEIEANQFAMELLMPEKFIRNDFPKGFFVSDIEHLNKMAKKYKVELPILVVRLTQIFL